jgi:glucose dehydrogenase
MTTERDTRQAPELRRTSPAARRLPWGYDLAYAVIIGLSVAAWGLPSPQQTLGVLGAAVLLTAYAVLYRSKAGARLDGATPPRARSVALGQSVAFMVTAVTCLVLKTLAGLEAAPLVGGGLMAIVSFVASRWWQRLVDAELERQP